MAEPDPFERANVDERRHRLLDVGKQRLWSGMKQKGLLVTHKELAEL
jgi:hypothetical protein